MQGVDRSSRDRRIRRLVPWATLMALAMLCLPVWYFLAVGRGIRVRFANVSGRTITALALESPGPLSVRSRLEPGQVAEVRIPTPPDRSIRFSYRAGSGRFELHLSQGDFFERLIHPDLDVAIGD